MTFRSTAYRVYCRWARTSDHSRRSIYAAINEAYDAGKAAALATAEPLVRERVLHEICKVAGDMEALRALADAAGANDRPVSLGRARSLLRELAAVGGPLDPQPVTTGSSPSPECPEGRP